MSGQPASERLLEVRQLSVAYATQARPVVAVDSVDLDLDSGEFLAVVGESGCGKSTLLFAVSQLLNPNAGITGGSVVFRGREMAEMSGKQLRHVRWREFSVVMQSAMNALNPVMTVAEQMRDACKAHSTMSNEEIADRSAEVLRLVSIDPVHLESYPHQLSGGMRQRSMIAMALLFTPAARDHGRADLGSRRRGSALADAPDKGPAGPPRVRGDLRDPRHLARESLLDRLMVMYAGQVAELGPTSDDLQDAAPPLCPRAARGFPLDPRREDSAHRHCRLATGRVLAGLLWV